MWAGEIIAHIPDVLYAFGVSGLLIFLKCCFSCGRLRLEAHLLAILIIFFWRRKVSSFLIWMT
jgi:hypothetical protein